MAIILNKKGDRLLIFGFFWRGIIFSFRYITGLTPPTRVTFSDFRACALGYKALDLTSPWNSAPPPTHTHLFTDRSPAIPPLILSALKVFTHAPEYPYLFSKTLHAISHPSNEGLHFPILSPNEAVYSKSLELTHPLLLAFLTVQEVWTFLVKDGH